DMVSPVLPQMMLENVLQDRQTGGPRQGAVALGRPAQAMPSAITTYRASPAVSQRVKQHYVDFIRNSVGPQGAAQYEAVLARNDPVGNWATLVADQGFRPGDVADALASYWMLNYLIANGVDDAPGASPGAVARQVRGILVQNPAFIRLDEGQRQEMAEIY